MVLVLDAPSTVDLAKADGQPKLEATRLGRATDCGRPATHDGDRKGDGVSDAYLQLFDVEGLPRSVIGEEQIPGLLVCRHAARLQRRRHVEHHDVVIVMRQYGRQVMPPDGVCPSFDECLDLGFRGSSSFRHDSCSRRNADPCPENERGFANATRIPDFLKAPAAVHPTRYTVTAEASPCAECPFPTM